MNHDRPTYAPMTALALVSVFALGGCTPAPGPTPTPTALFASEEEAFAAAEETYAKYLDAAAARGDGDEAATPEDFLIGSALESHYQTRRDLDEARVSIVGAATIHAFKGLDADIATDEAKITAEICVNISASRVLDAKGTDVTPADRPERGLLRVEFSGNSELLRIEDSDSAGDVPC